MIDAAFWPSLFGAFSAAMIALKYYFVMKSRMIKEQEQSQKSVERFKSTEVGKYVSSIEACTKVLQVSIQSNVQAMQELKIQLADQTQATKELKGQTANIQNSVSTVMTGFGMLLQELKKLRAEFDAEKKNIGKVIIK